MELGFNNGISNEDYHADREYISSSALKLILRDPKEYFKRYVKGDKDPTTSRAAFDFGTYIHSLILEPDTIEKEFAIFEGASRRGKVYEEFKENNEGKIIITKSQNEKAKSMIEAFKENKKANNIIDLENGIAEQTICTKLEDVKIKIRADYNHQTTAMLNDEIYPFGLIVDIKTTSDPIDKFSVGKTIARYDYDLSAALYIDVLEQQLEVPQTFIFCFMSKTTNEVEVYQASDEMIENGRRKYKSALKKLKEARKTGIYYNEDVIPTVNLPYWAKFEEDENDRERDDSSCEEIKGHDSTSGKSDVGDTLLTAHRPEGC